jgi:deoxyhypusine synthase
VLQGQSSSPVVVVIDLFLAQNDIPVFSPALTDGSLGDMLYFHSYKNPGFIIDIVGDIRRLNDISIHAKKAGMIVLGGGVCKHQIANAMLFVSQGQSG